MATSSSSHAPARPRGLLKWAFNVPRLLYRVHLGWLLGHRFLLLTHRGRKTGVLHQTILEVVRYDPRTRESTVLSAYGDRSDWYRNIQAHLALELRTGRDRYTPAQRTLTPDETYTVLADYRRRYGPLLGLVLRYMGYAYTGKEEELRAIAAQTHAVGFRPREGGDVS
ncbi:MAG TPA: nitroreductase family deazaflavin-dependent oxidoreductase [Ktedonobacterales bacterium]